MTTFINSLTISRIAFAVLALFIDSYTLLFLIAFWAAFSDFVDGFLARTLQRSTPTGAKLDQMADKIFHSLLLIKLYQVGEIDFFFLALFFVREFLMIAFRYFKFSAQTSNQLGKFKTLLIYLLIIFIFGVHTLWPEITPSIYPTVVLVEWAILVVGYLSLVLSLGLLKAKKQP